MSFAVTAFSHSFFIYCTRGNFIALAFLVNFFFFGILLVNSITMWIARAYFLLADMFASKKSVYIYLFFVLVHERLLVSVVISLRHNGRFLSYCQIPDHLPVTIACHNTDRCWSSSPEQRTVVPYPEFPKLLVV